MFYHRCVGQHCHANLQIKERYVHTMHKVLFTSGLYTVFYVSNLSNLTRWVLDFQPLIFFVAVHCISNIMAGFESQVRQPVHKTILYCQAANKPAKQNI